MKEYSKTTNQPAHNETIIGMSLETPRLEEGRPLRIAGLKETYTDETRQSIPEHWQRFMTYLGRIPGQVGEAAYGVCSQNPIRTDCIDYLTGVEVLDTSGLPAEFSSVTIPRRFYAIFAHRGHVSGLYQTIDAIFHQWLPKSGHVFVQPSPGEPAFFERYGKDFDPRRGLGDVEVWVPIQN